MRRIAIIEDGRVANVALRPAGYAIREGEAEAGEDVAIGWIYDGEGGFAPDPAGLPTPGDAARERLLRFARDVGMTATPEAQENLAGWAALASATVDLQAGALRETIGTPGYGQTTEYDRTLEDARAFLEAAGADPATDPAGYPMVQAELDALEQATGLPRDPEAVAQEIVDLAAAWHAALAAIKRVRRLAKMRIQAAAGVEEIADILAGVEWPEVEG